MAGNTLEVAGADGQTEEANRDVFWRIKGGIQGSKKGAEGTKRRNYVFYGGRNKKKSDDLKIYV